MVLHKFTGSRGNGMRHGLVRGTVRVREGSRGKET